MAVVSVLQPDSQQMIRVWRRHLLVWARSYRTSLLLNFVEPITILLALGMGLGSYVHQIDGMSFVQFIAPGLVSVTAMQSTSFDALFGTYNSLNENRVYPSMITSPLTPDDLVGGTLLWEATRATVFGGIFLIILIAFGLVHSWTVLLVLPLLALTGVLFAAPAMAVATIATAFDQLFYYITLVITPMFMFSGIFFPPNRLPHAVQWIIWFTPLYHVAHLARGLVLGTLSGSLWTDAVWLLIATAVLLLLPTRLLSRKLLV